MNLRDALENSKRQTFCGIQDDPIARDVLNSKNFPLLEKFIDENGYSHFEPLSGGLNAVVLSFGDKVLKLGFGVRKDRFPLDVVIPVLDSGSIGFLQYVIQPKADTDGVTNEDLSFIVEALNAKGFHWGDSGLDNIGKHEGKVFIDDEGIMPKACR